ncbi:MAG: hypothetical protein NZ901_09425 [Geminocystis sp.]|nr:hypothetical protein [Geminocystis sp.]MCS7148395.1 hypothetical protein [Geminocystis sp.]MDW8463642.1 hypothetical protein [Geminocystis sp.]HIK38879.1 hypothetical protein [Geminocystis sp. M7585_C2015_104]
MCNFCISSVLLGLYGLHIRKNPLAVRVDCHTITLFCQLVSSVSLVVSVATNASVVFRLPLVFLPCLLGVVRMAHLPYTVVVLIIVTASVSRGGFSSQHSRIGLLYWLVFAAGNLPTTSIYYGCLR